MSGLLTEQFFKEELRNFAKGTLRAELQVLGDRVQQDLASELRNWRFRESFRRRAGAGAASHQSSRRSDVLVDDADSNPRRFRSSSPDAGFDSEASLMELRSNKVAEWQTRKNRGLKSRATSGSGRKDQRASSGPEIDVPAIHVDEAVSVPGTPAGSTGSCAPQETVDVALSLSILPSNGSYEARRHPRTSSAWLDEGEAFRTEMSQVYYQRDHKVSDAASIFKLETRRSGSSLATTLGFFEAVLDDYRFHNVMALLLLVNLVTVGVETELLADGLNEKLPLQLTLAEVFFCMVFGVEILTRLLVYRRAFFTMACWHWNVFDGLLVLLQLSEQVLAYLLWNGEAHFNFSFLRALRVLRIIRVLRAARILEHMQELQSIVLSIGGALRSLCWTLLLLALLIYAVGVCFTQAVAYKRLSDRGSALPAGLTHYASLGSSIFTLYGSIMGGVDWGTAAEALLREVHPVLGLFYVLYVAFAVLAMMNVVTGVFVEAATKTARDHQEAAYFDLATRLFEHADLDESGLLSWQEFQKKLRHRYMVEFFKAIDVDIREAETVFRLLDSKDIGKIDLEQFMGGCLRLRGSAKAVDLAMLMHETRRMARRSTRQLGVINEKLEGLLREKRS